MDDINSMKWSEWEKEGDPITINKIVWDKSEIDAVLSVFRNDWFGPGEIAKNFQETLSDLSGIKHVQLTNSGSSALLLSTVACQNLGLLKKGDKILHPLCTFPTSVSSVYQTGMTPVYVDVEEGTYNIDIDKVAQALDEHPDIWGVIIPHLLGNSPKMDELVDLIGDSRVLIEDCCDTLGSQYDGKPVGSFGTASATSFYGSHHITTAGVGGASFTNDDEIAQQIRSMAFWGRSEYWLEQDEYERFRKRYWYDTIGYDMQMTEIQAAFGLAQLSRLSEMNKNRDNQFSLTYEFMKQWEDLFVMPVVHPKAKPSWFGFPIVIKPNKYFDIKDFVRYLFANKIEVRPLFVGNILKHPAFKNENYIQVGGSEVSDSILEGGLFLPAWGHMDDRQTGVLFDKIKRFMDSVLS